MSAWYTAMSEAPKEDVLKELLRQKERADEKTRDLEAIDRLLCARFARSVRVESKLLDFFKAKQSPTPDQCRTMALELGIPDEARHPVERIENKKIQSSWPNGLGTAQYFADGFFAVGSDEHRRLADAIDVRDVIHRDHFDAALTAAISGAEAGASPMPTERPEQCGYCGHLKTEHGSGKQYDGFCKVPHCRCHGFNAPSPKPLEEPEAVARRTIQAATGDDFWIRNSKGQPRNEAFEDHATAFVADAIRSDRLSQASLHQAEMAKMREALLQIGGYLGKGPPTTDWQGIVRECGKIARAALNPKEGSAV